MPKLLTSIAAAAVFAAGFTVASEQAASLVAARHSNSVSKAAASNTLKKGDRLDIGRVKECTPNQVVGQQTTGCSSPADQTPISPQRTVVVELIRS